MGQQKHPLNVSTYKGVNMANFIQNVENGLANLISTSATSKLTEHLRTWKTVPKYYRGQLERIRKGKKGALKSIKKTSSGEYLL